MNNLTFTPTYFFPHYDHLTATNNFHDSTRIYTLDSINSHLAAFNETLSGLPIPISPGYPEKPEFMSIENLKTYGMSSLISPTIPTILSCRWSTAGPLRVCVCAGTPAAFNRTASVLRCSLRGAHLHLTFDIV